MMGTQKVGDVSKNVWRELLRWGIHFRICRKGMGKRGVGVRKIEGLLMTH